MATRKYVSNIEASYFIEHQLHCLPEPPTTGSYKVGDVIISSQQEKETFGWVCIESGEPGTWKSIGDFKDLRGEIVALQNKDIEHDDLIVALRQRLEELYGELKDKNNAQDINVNNINGQVQSNADSINKLMKDIESLGGDNTSLGNELRNAIDEINRKVKTNIDNIGENKLDINELKRISEKFIIEYLESCDSNKIISDINYMSDKVITLFKTKIEDTKQNDIHFDSIKVHRTILGSYEKNDLA
jgi:hypothetical protein